MDIIHGIVFVLSILGLVQLVAVCVILYHAWKFHPMSGQFDSNPMLYPH